MIPQDRTEEYYAAILGAITGEGEATAPSPVWRKEEFLAAILAAAKGEEPSIPDPVWRDEAWLALIAQALSGGGGGGLTLVASKEFTANVTSSSDVDIGTIDCGPSIYGSDKIVIVRIRDKAGSRNAHYYGSLTMCIAYTQGGSAKTYVGTIIFMQTNLGTIAVTGNASSYGIRVTGISDQGVITLKAKYSVAAGTIDGTFLVEVFVVGEPGGVDMLAGNPIT